MTTLFPEDERAAANINDRALGALQDDQDAGAPRRRSSGELRFPILPGVSLSQGQIDYVGRSALTGVAELGRGLERAGASIFEPFVGVAGIAGADDDPDYYRPDLSDAERSRRLARDTRDARDYAERTTTEWDRSADAMVNAIVPDPEGVDPVTGLLGGVARMLPPALIGGALGGPIGAATFSAGARAPTAYEEQIASGVDPETARTAAAIDASYMGAMTLLPASVPVRGARFDPRAFALRAGSGVALNVPTGMAMRGSIAAYLEGAGYPEQARNYDWLDATAIATDAILGAAFGGFMGEIRSSPGGAAETATIPALSAEEHIEASVRLSEGENPDPVMAYAHARVAALMGDPEGAARMAELVETHGPELAQAGDTVAAIMAVREGLVRPDRALVDDAMAARDARHAEIDAAPGVPLNHAARAQHSRNLAQAHTQARAGEDIAVGNFSEDAEFAPHYRRDVEILDALNSVLARVAAAGADIPRNDFDTLGVALAYPKPDATRVSARPATEDGEIVTAWGARLQVRAGRDIVVGEAQNDARPVRRDIFEATYQEVAPGLYAKRSDVPVGYFALDAARTIETLEGPVDANAGDVVLIGAAGEMWPVSAAKFAERYDVAASAVSQAETSIVNVLEEEGFADLARDIAEERRRLGLSDDEPLFSARGRDPQFSVGQSRGFFSVEDLQSFIASDLGLDWARASEALRLDIVPDAATLRQVMGDAGYNASQAPDGVQGVHLRGVGRTLLVADALNPEDVMPVLIHEIGYHHGMADMLGAKGMAEMDRHLARLVREGHPLVMHAMEEAARASTIDNLAEEIGAYTVENAQRIMELAAQGRLSEAPPQLRAAALAKLIETSPDLPLVSRLLANLRQWLIRKFGTTFGMRLTVNDIRELAVASLNRAFERGVRESQDVRVLASTRGRPAPRSPFYSGVERALEQSTTQRASGAQWWATISRAPGVKKEELEWIGLEDWLKARDDELPAGEALDNQAPVDEALVARAVEHFGLTNDPREAGYVLPDGKLLDLSGRHEMLGGDYVRQGQRNVATGRDWQAGQRQTDHRELPSELGLGPGSGTERMFRFQTQAGAVRLMPGSGISVTVRPTRRQIEAIARMWNKEWRGELLHIDFDAAQVQAIAEGRIAAAVGVTIERPNVESITRAIDEHFKQPDAQQRASGIPREEVLAFVRANGVQVEETVLGDQGASGELQARLLPLIEERERLERSLDPLMPAIAQGTLTPEQTRQAGETRTRILALSREIIPLQQQIADASRATSTKWSQFQLPGGENYRELLLRLPGGIEPGFRIEQKNGRWAAYNARGDLVGGADTREALLASMGPSSADFRSSHFDQPNILAHVRFNERVDADGRRTLFIEELQSDWHQAGRERGYWDDLPADQATVERQADGTWIVRWPRGIERHVVVGAGDDPVAFAREAQRAVPDAPFKNNAWASLALKRMIRWAAENGFDQIAWTPGQVQVERFNIEKVLDRMEYDTRTPGGNYLRGFKDGQMRIGRTVSPEELPGVVGKELAERLLAQPLDAAHMHVLTGSDLRVGGEGMRAFYDRILVNIANDLGKKFGARVGEAAVDITPQAGRLEFTVVDAQGQPYDAFDTLEAARQAARDAGVGYRVIEGSQPVHALPITDAMREAAMEGQALFSARGGQNPPGGVGGGRGKSDPVSSPEYRAQVDALRASDPARQWDDAGAITGEGPASAGEVARGLRARRGAIIQGVLARSGVRIARTEGGVGMPSHRISIDAPFEIGGDLGAAISAQRGESTGPTHIEFDFIDGNNPKDPRLPGVHLRLTRVNDALKGMGVGTWLYRQLIDWADRQGLSVYSDAIVSDHAQGVYARLEELGYKVEGPAPRKREGDGHITLSGRPMYAVKSYDVQEALPGAPLPRDDYEFDGPSLRERIAQAQADDAAYSVSMNRAAAMSDADVIAWGNENIAVTRNADGDEAYRMRSRDDAKRRDVELAWTDDGRGRTVGVARWLGRTARPSDMARAPNAREVRRALQVFSRMLMATRVKLLRDRPQLLEFAGATGDHGKLYRFLLERRDLPGYRAFTWRNEYTSQYSDGRPLMDETTDYFAFVREDQTERFLAGYQAKTQEGQSPDGDIFRSETSAPEEIGPGRDRGGDRASGAGMDAGGRETALFSARRDYEKLEPVAQVLADSPDASVATVRGDVSAREALRATERAEAEAKGMEQAFEAAVRCASRHGVGAVGGATGLAEAMAGQALGAAAGLPSSIGVGALIADARPPIVAKDEEFLVKDRGPPTRSSAELGDYMGRPPTWEETAQFPEGYGLEPDDAPPEPEIDEGAAMIEAFSPLLEAPF